MIALRHVDLDAGDRALLRDVDAEMRAGEFVALLGRNGVGKTTLLRAIAGQRPCAGGAIVVDDRNVHDIAPAQRARSIAFVTADELMTDALVVRDVVALGRYAHHRWWQWTKNPHDDVAVQRALDDVGMSSFAGRLLHTLSTGERQRVWIAMAIAQEAPVMLLDEPTSHLDIGVAHAILALLRNLARSGKTIICVMHDLNDAATYADRIALLGQGGLLAFDVPDRVLASQALEAAYDVEMERVPLADGRLRVFARDAQHLA